MKLPLRFHCLAVLWFCLSSILSARASHLLGGDIRYEYEGTAAFPFQYHVTATVFTDTSPGVTVTTPDIMLTCGKNACSATSPGSFTFLLQLTRRELINTGCGGTGAVSYAVNTLEGTVQLPPAQWTLSIDGTNRSSDIINITQPVVQSQYIQAELNNLTGLTNSAPRFNSDRLIQLAGVQSNQRYSLSAFDREGDSLVYQLVQPTTGPDAAHACGAPIGAALAPHFQLDAATGTLLTTNGPAQQGRYNLTARVDEYRRLSGQWQRIGRITRDMTYFVQLSTGNPPPTFTRVALASAPGGQLLGQTIRATAGQPLALALTATNATAGQLLTLSSTAAGIVPGATFQDQGNGQGLLTWPVPAGQQPGRYFLAVTAENNACPITGREVLTLPILVAAQALASRPRQALAQAPWPNPFREDVQLRLSTTGQQTITITDGLGRVVARLRTAPDGSLTWRPAAAVTAGLYFAQTADGSQVARLAYAGQ